MAKDGKQYAKINGTWEQIKPSYDDLTDVPTDFNPTSHTHGNMNDDGQITAEATIATGDHLVIADNSSNNDLTTSSITFDTSNTSQFLRKDGVFAAPAGDIQGVTAGTGLFGGGSSGTVSLSVDLSELTDMTDDVDGLADELILLDNGADRRKLISEIKLSQFNNDSGFASGDITNLTAGTGLTGGGSSGSVTVNAVGGTGITANANDLAISSEFSPRTATELTSSVDLNDLQGAQAGFYYQTANADTSGNNYPSGEAGSLLVQKSAGQVTQTYITYSTTPKVYVRTYYQGWSSWKRLFTDDYHPNADKLTTARTITLGGDLVGNVSFDGSANVTLSGAVANDSHTHDGRYYTESEVNTLLDAKVSAASPALTGTPTAPTAASNNNSTQIATTAYVQGEITDLIGGAPGALDTLNELAAAINDDESFASSVTTSLAGKLSTSGGTISGNLSVTGTITSNGLTVSNDNIVGVNTLEINDPGEGIKFKQGSSGDMELKILDDSFDSILDFSGTNAALSVNGTSVSLDGHNHDSRYYTETEIDNFGYTSNAGTVTNVTVGTGLDVSNGTSTPSITLDLSEFTDMTDDVNGLQDELILLDNGAERRKLISEIKLSQFNNDSGFTTNSGDITAVTAGNGLTGGGSSGSVVLHHEDTSSQASVNNSGRTYIQDITLDGYGHITGITSATETVTDTQLSDEQVQDIVGAMVSGTESGIAVTYDDTNNRLNFNVNDPTITLAGDLTGSATMTNLGDVTISAAVANDSHTHDGRYYTESEMDTFLAGKAASSHQHAASNITSGEFNLARLGSGNANTNYVLKSDGDGTASWQADSNTFRTVTAGGNTLGATETLAFAAGDNVSISENAGTVTINATDTNTNTFRTVTAGGNTLNALENLDLIAGDNISISESAGDVTFSSSHPSVSAASSVNNSGSTFIQDITLDSYGHITGITSAAASGGGNTWTEIKTGSTTVTSGANATNISISTSVDDTSVIAFELNTSSVTSYTSQIFIVKLEDSNNEAAGILFNAGAYSNQIRTGSIRVYRTLSMGPSSTSVTFTYSYYHTNGSTSESADQVYIGKIWKLGVTGA